MGAGKECFGDVLVFRCLTACSGTFRSAVNPKKNVTEKLVRLGMQKVKYFEQVG